MKTLLITGGSGYLGSQLAPAAAARGWTVYATYFSNPVSLDSVQMLPVDLRDADRTLALLHDLHPQAVIHAACSNRSEQPYHIVPAAQSVAAAARALSLRLVHVSSDTVFDGDHAPYADEALPAPVMSYGRAKAEAEAVVSQLCPSAVIGRPSLIWGLQPPLDHQTNWLVEGLRRGERVTLFTDEYRCPVYVDDLCAALLELANLPQIAGPLNLGGAQSLSRWDFGQKLLVGLNVPPGPNLVPSRTRDSGLVRPRDLTLLSNRAAQCLQSKLRGVDEVLAARGAR
jgi:dTDP-4-dehydrorhamnose reductase